MQEILYPQLINEPAPLGTSPGGFQYGLVGYHAATANICCKD